MVVCVARSSSVARENQRQKLYSVSTQHVIPLLCEFVTKLHSETESEAGFSQDSVCMPGMFQKAGKTCEACPLRKLFTASSCLGRNP